VDVRDPTGGRLAVGISNYNSIELDKIRGQRSDRIGDVLGYSYGEEAIHRDNLVLL
jgi:glutamate 5-kinase